MDRNASTTYLGQAFDRATINAVWRKGRIIPGVDPARSRLDSCGARIDYNQYGVTIHNGTGWEIDHIVPVARGGTDNLLNLQPLQWQNNRAKGDQNPNAWTCAVRASGS